MAQKTLPRSWLGGNGFSIFTASRKEVVVSVNGLGVLDGPLDQGDLRGNCDAVPSPQRALSGQMASKLPQQNVRPRGTAGRPQPESCLGRSPKHTGVAGLFALTEVRHPFALRERLLPAWGPIAPVHGGNRRSARRLGGRGRRGQPQVSRT